MSEVQERNEVRIKIASIREKMACSRGFECLSSGFDNLFRENNFTGGDCPECKATDDCQFKSDIGCLYLCRCPLRMYVFSLIKVDKDAGMAVLPSKYAYNVTTCGAQPDQ